MTQPPGQPHQDSSAASTLVEARLIQRERWSLVWLVPLAAVAIGAWLAIHAISSRGPTITIEFNTASGLQAGKTKVRFKDVVIGQVTAIALSENLEKVLVTAELRPDSAHYLTDKTRFWVARPMVTASQVSGLETLLSGAYVGIDPVMDGASTRHFIGLNTPPVITTAEPGSKFSLRARSLGSLNLGSPVYFRHIQVGQVVSYQLDDDGSAVTIEIFVTQPHDRLVFATTRFWNASGIDARLGADGISVDTESLLSMLIGGIAFDTPETLAGRGAPATDGQFFPLYANRREAHERTYLEKLRYVLLFDGSVRGLSVNAPVMLRGIEIGHVLDVRLEFDPERTDFQVPVLIEIEPERVDLLPLDRPSDLNGGDAGTLLTTHPDQALMSALVEKGLRAQLKTGSLLTGQLYVEFDLHPDAAPAVIGERGGNPVLPTLPTPLGAMTAQVERILNKVEAIPLRRIGDDVSATLAGVRALIDSEQVKDALNDIDRLLKHLAQVSARMDQTLLPELSRTLKQAERAFSNLNAQLSPDAPLSVETLGALREFQSAARALRDLADYLERHPEALLKGKGGGR